MKYKSEIFDRFQKLYEVTGFNDHQLHCVMRLEARIDSALLKKALLATMDAIPVLGSRYIDAGRKPYWESLETKDLDRVLVEAPSKDDFAAAITFRVDENIGPQLRVCLYQAETSAIAVTMNHMICDGAGLKEYLYFLCETYSKLSEDPSFRPKKVQGRRDLHDVVARFGFRRRLASLVSKSDENNRAGDRRFPLSEATEGGEAKPFILTRAFGRGEFAALREYCKTQEATVNDVVLAAFFRCLFNRLTLPIGEKTSLSFMVDMRRYLAPGTGLSALRNLSSTVMTGLEYRSGEEFLQTLDRVKAIMKEKKNGELGLNAFFKLEVLHKLLPWKVASRVLRSHLRNPLITMTNLGIIDSDGLSFGKVGVSDAFVCGSIKYKPHFQIALSTFDGVITFSSNFYGNDDDRERVSTFLTELTEELAWATKRA